ncbi:hypothetical protein PFISCL1PPCAC_27981, partial [Pristionchus fissidentatus]
VFYVVDADAPNTKVVVAAPTEKMGIAVHETPRYVTFLSSFDAVEFSGFAGTFPAGYPKIYATGKEVMGQPCNPVYEARSQRNAERSWPAIYSPVTTVDFGYEGVHSVSVTQKTGRTVDPMKNGGASVVYMSPGYIGCPFTQNQAYFSRMNSIEDAFGVKSETNALDFVDSYTSITPNEIVHLNINQQIFDMEGTSQVPFKKHLDAPSFAVAISWARRTPGASFALQLDFGVGAVEMQPTTKTTTTTQISTTSSGRSLIALPTLFIILISLIR